MIQMQSVTKVYRQDGQEITALREINLTIARSEFVAITGPSGSGKSTLLNLIGGLDHPTAGTVTVDGSILSSLSDDEMTLLRRKTIGVIFQFFNLLPHLTVWENVALPILLRGDPRASMKTAVELCLEKVGLLGRLRHRPHELSGGEQQRVAIARALVIEPKVLLADEPTGNLDSGIGGEILDLIKKLSIQQGIAVLLATHSPIAASYANRSLQLKDGKFSE